MGMSASQARLLSITTRITNNELRAQTITNSKLRLADKSTEASQDYMNALNSQKLVYSCYNDNGESEQMDMTAGLIYTYSPLKNQYALINSAGKMLVSSKDAENFKNSADLYVFLDAYGLIEDSASYNKYEEDHKKYKAEKKIYDEELLKYDDEKKQYDALKTKWDDYNQKYAEYQTAYAEYQTKYATYQTEYAEYEEKMKEYNSISPVDEIFMNTVKPSGGTTLFCYEQALNSGNADCFLHLLNHLIDYDGVAIAPNREFQTSTGITFTPSNNSLGGMGVAPELKEVSDALNDTSYIRYCDGDDNFNEAGNQNLIQDAIDQGRVPTELEILKSDFKYDPSTNTVTGLKTLKEKAQDIYYIIQNELGPDKDKDEMTEILRNFTEGDMTKLKPEEPIPPAIPVEPTAPTPLGPEPIMPVPPTEPTEPEYDITINDKDKAQWYVNLWHMMNGSETANLVKSTDYAYQNTEDSGSLFNDIIFSVKNTNKNDKTANYAVFDDSLINNSEWLQFALEHGVVTLAKAEFFDPSVDSGKTPELTSEAITWKSTIYTNASEFKMVDDEVAIAIAEVKYKNAMTEIENQDKKFDQDLKKLDTEHTALETEYESIKEVLSKNVERSFKAFS